MNIKIKEFFYISNLFSILRIFIGIPIYYFLGKTDPISFYIVPILGFIAIISDYFDGYFSRKLNQVTELGKLLDPIADKICGVFVLLGLMVYRDYPYGILFLLLYRDILILIFGSIITKREGKVVSSIFLGKLNTTLMGISAFFFCIKLNTTLDLILIFSVYLMTIISGVAYLRLGEKMLNLSGKSKILFRLGISLLSLIFAIIFAYLTYSVNHFLI